LLNKNFFDFFRSEFCINSDRLYFFHSVVILIFIMKFSVFFCALVVQVISIVESNAVNKFQVVQTEYGPVKGVKKETILGRDYFSFQGIPYMMPPLGKLRFKAPEPPSPWKDPVDATGKSPAYTQINTQKLQLEGQEDAGVINVFTPSLSKSSSLPVLVWIHGGSFHVNSKA
jgi:hypothetical protein